ncbi:hypothetical protein HZA87_05400 [Candidatus Uhrbacteria bacterium]|nr:hypothetical protein [Candidatus Uhrbacteria bacterium]
MSETFSFLSSFWNNPAEICSVVPTFSWSARKIARVIPPDVWQQKLLINECGPGTGAITDQIRRLMSEDSRLVLVEKDRALADLLKHKFAADPRITVHTEGAEHIEGIMQRYGRADLNFNMTPITIMPDVVRTRMLDGIRNSLTETGRSVTALFRPFAVPRILRDHFPVVRYRGIAPLNVPPLFIFESRTVVPTLETVASTTVECRRLAAKMDFEMDLLTLDRT